MYAYHAYHANGMLPSVFAALPRREQLMIMAFIDVKTDQEKKAAKEFKK